MSTEISNWGLVLPGTQPRSLLLSYNPLFIIVFSSRDLKYFGFLLLLLFFFLCRTPAKSLKVSF